MQDRPHSLSHLSDEALVELVQQHDKHAFSLLYDRYIRLVYTMAVHMIGRTEAEEVVQEIFIRLWHKRDRFDATRGAFKSWFMRVARNHMKDYLRQRQRHNHHTQVVEWPYWLDDLVDPTADVKESVHLQEQQATIQGAIERLPAEQRQVILLAYFGDYSQSSIAQALGWPLGTVKKRIRLGLQKLRQIILTPEAAREPQALPTQKSDS